MEAFGWIAAVVGNALFIAALLLTVRANPGTRIPFWRNAPIIPAGSIAMRSMGAGLLVLGAIALASIFSFWSVAIVWGGPLVALLVIPLHNYRVTASTGRRGR